MPRRQSVATVIAILLGCGLGSAPVPPGSLRVLFIGNSLTYANGLPRTVADLARSANLPPCHCVAIAYPDFSLEDHYLRGDALRALRDQSFDFVVLQQGPSALPESRTSLVQWALAFAPLIRQAGATPVLYGVWPAAARPFDFPGVRDSYRAASDTIDGLLAPAGEAWQRAWERDATLALYAADGFHPSPMGTYLAAMVVFQRLYGHSPVGPQTVAQVDGRAQPWPAAVVRLLQEAAAAAVAGVDGVGLLRDRAAMSMLGPTLPGGPP